ncbi:asparagine synthase-related protein [Massilia solisilvae]|uniref:asparagine synthase (glutamine-hydrolyzing) n=1 Tax=Massilia solisilvae TaxID=1811225 RepID=A0ABT2BE87_9BURK|nr:asparagine synthetase B family protein [Massilia solisilvae]MCS0606797.1 asparagine synthase-related protein [Massilia solisilvae]
MQEMLTPYGRDAQAARIVGNAGLLRTLLLITPEDRHDAQPLLDGANQCALLFDGRLDNREELAAALGLTAADIASMADSQLALLACLRWDTAALPRMLGDFAIAMWQPARARLWLARSPLGRRPLFWHRQDGFFAFATMPKALLAIPGVPCAPGETRLYEDLAMVPPSGPGSFFKDIARVQPGHVVTLDGTGLRSTPYHRFDNLKMLRLPSDQDYVDAFREHLDRAVARALRSAGKVASHLSSGFDSSTVTAVAARLLDGRGQDLLSYTSIPRPGFGAALASGRHADERAGATALSKRFPNIRHFLVNTDRVSPLDLLDPMVARLDRAPMNLMNLVWVTAINEHAVQQGAKVLLTGQKGNMTISYSGFRFLYSLLRSGDLGQWLHELRGFRRNGASWGHLLRSSFGPMLPQPVWNALQAARRRPGNTTGSPVHPRFVARMSASHPSAGVHVRRLPGQQMRIHVLMRQDPGEYYAAANWDGLEWRDPTADLRLVEFLLSVPERQFGHHGQDRWLLRRAMHEVLPPEITQARTKGLQCADWYETLTPEVPRMRSLVEEAARSSRVGEYVDLAPIEQALACWPSADEAKERGALDMQLQRTIAATGFMRYVENWDAASAVRPPQNLLDRVENGKPLFTPAKSFV